MVMIKTPKKLIEVALPLDAINVAAAGEKSIPHGHSTTLRLWWARRLLVTAPAVIFAHMVNDPGNQHEGSYYVPQPLTQEPDWAVTNINLDLPELLKRSVYLGGSLR